MKIGKRTIYADQIVLLVCLAVILLGAGVTYDSLNFKDSTISSKDDMTFQIDSDSNGANLYYWKNGAGTTLRAMNEAGDVTQSFGTYRIVGDLTIGTNGHTGYPLTVESGSNSDIDGLRVTRAGTPSQYMMIGTYGTGTIAFTGGVNKDMVIKNNSTTSGDILFQTNGSNSYGTVRYDGQFRSGSGSPAADRDTAAEAQLWVDGIAWADDGLAVGGNGSTVTSKYRQYSAAFTDSFTTIASFPMGSNNGASESDVTGFLFMVNLASGPSEDAESELWFASYVDEGGADNTPGGLISETGTDFADVQVTLSGGSFLIQARHNTASGSGTANVTVISGSVFDN